MVVEAVSKLQSVNPEFFPGKLKHSSHLGRMAGLCNATPVGAGPAGATTHSGEKATIPAALLYLRDFLQVLSPCWLWPQCTEQACMQALCPKLGRKASHGSFCFLYYAQGYFYLVSKEGPWGPCRQSHPYYLASWSPQVGGHPKPGWTFLLPDGKVKGSLATHFHESSKCSVTLGKL